MNSVTSSPVQPPAPIEQAVDGLGPGASFWRVAATAPDTLALVCPDTDEFSFGALAQLVNQASNALRAAGLSEGDVLVYPPGFPTGPVSSCWRWRPARSACISCRSTGT